MRIKSKGTDCNLVPVWHEIESMQSWSPKVYVNTLLHRVSLFWFEGLALLGMNSWEGILCSAICSRVNWQSEWEKNMFKNPALRCKVWHFGGKVKKLFRKYNRFRQIALIASGIEFSTPSVRYYIVLMTSLLSFSHAAKNNHYIIATFLHSATFGFFFLVSLLLQMVPNVS